MLYHYLDHKRKESSAQLHATYLVSGKFVDKGQTVSLILQRLHIESGVCCLSFDAAFVPQSHLVSVVREDQLEGMKSPSVCPCRKCELS